MSSFRRNIWPYWIKCSYIDFNEGLFTISTKNIQTASDSFWEALECFLVVPLQCPHLTLTNSDSSMSLKSSLSWGEAAQVSPIAASTRKPGNQIHLMSTPKAFKGRIFMGSSSLGKWWVCKHPHQLHGSLGLSTCTHTSPSISFWAEEEVCSVQPCCYPVFLLHSHTTTEGCSLSDRSVTGVSPFCVPQTPLKGHLRQAVSPPATQACELLGLSQAPAVQAHALHLTHHFGNVTHFGPITAVMNWTLFTLWNCHSSQLKFRQSHNGAIHTSH